MQGPRTCHLWGTVKNLGSSGGSHGSLQKDMTARVPAGKYWQVVGGWFPAAVGRGLRVCDLRHVTQTRSELGCGLKVKRWYKLQTHEAWGEQGGVKLSHEAALPGSSIQLGKREAW